MRYLYAMGDRVNTDFRSSQFFLIHSLLFTHFRDTQEADFYGPSYFDPTRRNKNKNIADLNFFCSFDCLAWPLAILFGCAVVWDQNINIIGHSKVIIKLAKLDYSDTNGIICIRSRYSCLYVWVLWG